MDTYKELSEYKIPLQPKAEAYLVQVLVETQMLS